MAANGYFITGTDTGVGKTEVTLGLMAGLQARGQRVLGMKPVASGSAWREGMLVNDDAWRIRQQGSEPVDYSLINPYAFEPPIAPHLAARDAGREIDLEVIGQAYRQLAASADWVLVEGVGGWRVPLNGQAYLADLASRMGLPVILVVGLRLGCINHALLTVESIQQRGCRLAGWVANHLEPGMARSDENIATLKERIGAPCLGVVEWLNAPIANSVTDYLSGY